MARFLLTVFVVLLTTNINCSFASNNVGYSKVNDDSYFVALKLQREIDNIKNISVDQISLKDVDLKQEKDHMQQNQEKKKCECDKNNKDCKCADEVH